MRDTTANPVVTNAVQADDVDIDVEYAQGLQEGGNRGFPIYRQQLDDVHLLHEGDELANAEGQHQRGLALPCSVLAIHGVVDRHSTRGAHPRERDHGAQVAACASAAATIRVGCPHPFALCARKACAPPARRARALWSTRATAHVAMAAEDREAGISRGIAWHQDSRTHSTAEQTFAASLALATAVQVAAGLAGASTLVQRTLEGHPLL